MFHGKISNLHAYAAASEFCELVQTGLDVHISHCKYHTKPCLSSWFFTYGAGIYPCNYFFGLFQQNVSSVREGKFRQAGNHYKMVLEAPKLAYANKTCPDTWLL